jgi:hypothetical protein
MEKQKQQLPPNRRVRRMQMRDAGILKALSKLAWNHPVKRQIQAENLKNGARIQQMHANVNDARIASALESKLESAKADWIKFGYNKEEMALLEEAWALNNVIDKATRKADRKQAKELMAKARESFSARN